MKKRVKSLLFFAFFPEEFQENATVTTAFFIVPLFFPHCPKPMLVEKKEGRECAFSSSISCFQL